MKVRFLEDYRISDVWKNFINKGIIIDLPIEVVLTEPVAEPSGDTMCKCGHSKDIHDSEHRICLTSYCPCTSFTPVEQEKSCENCACNESCLNKSDEINVCRMWESGQPLPKVEATPQARTDAELIEQMKYDSNIIKTIENLRNRITLVEARIVALEASRDKS